MIKLKEGENSVYVYTELTGYNYSMTLSRKGCDTIEVDVFMDYFTDNTSDIYTKLNLTMQDITPGEYHYEIFVDDQVIDSGLVVFVNKNKPKFKEYNG